MSFYITRILGEDLNIAKYYVDSLQRVSTLAENRIERVMKDYVHDNGLTREPF